MRAICESCARPQPIDWRPGDLCGDCGLAVREEVRCYWCAKWSPKGKFCRKCGAVSVGQELYGPARMLRHMGASVFEIPKLLTELDPELIETHQSIYSTHLAIANRQIDYARELSQGLYQKHWAAELEEELIPQLPWPEKELEKFTKSPLSEESVIPLLQDLALLAQFQRGEFKKLRFGAQLIHSNNTAIAAEAALQLSGWRALYTIYTEIKSYQLIEVLRVSPVPLHAAPRLAALGADPCPRYAQTGDSDTDFLILLLEQIVPSLEAALDSHDPMRRYAAAGQLIRKHCTARIGPTLRAAGEEQQLQLLQDIIRYKKPVPHLHEDLFAIYEATDNGRIARSVGHVISLAGIPGDSLRLMEDSGNERDIVHALLLGPQTPETFFEIGRRLVANGTFNMNQWGWDRAAKPGAMPVHFVEAVYPSASPEVRSELLRFAEMQIEAHAEPQSALERFLIRQCFAKTKVDTIGAAWASIHRIQMHRSVGLTVPCELSMANLEWCWAMPEFLLAIAGLMANPAAVQQTFVRDDFSRFLRTAKQDFFAAAVQYPNECQAVIAAAPQADPYTFCVRFAETLAKALESAR